MGRLLAGAVVACALALVPNAAAAGGAQLGLVHLNSKLRAQAETFDADGTHIATLLPQAGEKFPQPWPLSAVSFSSDGEYLVTTGFAKATDLKGGSSASLFAISVDEGAPAPISGSSGGVNPVAFPDGKTLAFARSLGKNSEVVSGDRVIRRTHARTSIWIGSLEGGEARRLTPWRIDGYDLPTSVSPDGSTLAYTSVTTDRSKRTRSRAFFLDLNTGISVPVGHRAAIAAFSPDGTRLALVIAHRFRHPHVRATKGGRSVLYDESDVYVEDRMTGALTQVTRGPAADTDPAWDPSGQRLAFRRYGDLLGREDAVFGIGDSIYEVNADGSCLTRVLHEDDGGFTAPAWRPGGDRGAGRIAC